MGLIILIMIRPLTLEELLTTAFAPNLESEAEREHGMSTG